MHDSGFFYLQAHRSTEIVMFMYGSLMPKCSIMHSKDPIVQKLFNGMKGCAGCKPVNQICILSSPYQISDDRKNGEEKKEGKEDFAHAITCLYSL